ncbi:hypothetical protein T265_05144 [Opisthorchis viverrini]|uniref:Uncharacterized protein n=1 Tax=Opisthorchis viverrini TaxID=6198 RepID=A0A074ZX59_OPIVI|nr:hypothetical protein T265_05144 [Opisthorchis viverrini]KER27945.1 hypothetical protein T265_05144 [Opisthorchis viverrini]
MKHNSWDTARLPKPRQKLRGRGRIRTTDLAIKVPINRPHMYTQPKPMVSFDKISLMRYYTVKMKSAEARWTKWLECEFTDHRVRSSNPTSASRLPLSRLGQPGSIPALVQPSGGMVARHRKGATAERFIYLFYTKGLHLLSTNLMEGRSVFQIPPLPLDFRCLGLGNLALPQPSCFPRVAWQLGTKRVLQLNDFLEYCGCNRSADFTTMAHQRERWGTGKRRLTKLLGSWGSDSDSAAQFGLI